MPAAMRAIVKQGPGHGFELREVPVPEVGPKDLLVKVRATSICGTDLHIFEWNQWAQGRIRTPLVIGHEFSGDVVAVGEAVVDFAGGEYVSAESHVICGVCRQCREGNGHICHDTTILGVDLDGSYAEFVRIPAKNAWKNPATLPPEFASLQEPLGNAVHTVLSGPISGKTCAVFGCGPQGLMAVGVARASGATKLFAVDVNDYRLDLARKMGATRTFNPTRDDVVGDILAETTDEGGVQVVCEMSGHPQAIRQGFEALANGGRYAMLGIPSGPVELDLASQIVFKGALVQGIIGRRVFETWYQTSALLASGRLDIAPLITHRFPLEHFAEAFALMQSGNCGKVVLTP
ncbi:MAG: L-threonine 3-dehydrogenase [Candidatus Sericytochromatia bacterium]|nr:L-threonine 3-dehydrogenase [Candidatus Tanganyikabacteria bacterium]